MHYLVVWGKPYRRPVHSVFFVRYPSRLLCRILFQSYFHDYLLFERVLNHFSGKGHMVVKVWSLWCCFDVLETFSCFNVAFVLMNVQMPMPVFSLA